MAEVHSRQCGRLLSSLEIAQMFETWFVLFFTRLASYEQFQTYGCRISKEYAFRTFRIGTIGNIQGRNIGHQGEGYRNAKERAAKKRILTYKKVDNWSTWDCVRSLGERVWMVRLNTLYSNIVRTHCIWTHCIRIHCSNCSRSVMIITERMCRQSEWTIVQRRDVLDK